MANESTSLLGQNDAGLAHLSGKYLTFALGKEKYGVEILKVQEIIGVMNITHVPKSPSYMKGVINLRGKIIPVIDLRLKFGMQSIPYDDKTCIIVVNLEINSSMIPVGIVVDTVLEVTHFSPADIESAPDYGISAKTKFILGMGQTKDNPVAILVDISGALTPEEIAGVVKAVAAN
ncbi:MAG: chemotaxis protein CheW [bacterium]|nr:chemotaxis protein CheW [bacterium]